MTRRPTHDQLPAVPPPDQVSSTLDREIDASFEALIIHRARKVSEGNNGIILRLNLKEGISEEARTLERSGIKLETDQAIKLIKVYLPGTARHEFEIQKRAHELVAASPNRDELAEVPRPLCYRDLQIGTEAQEALQSLGLTRVGKRVEIIVMDFVPGEDLATILMRELLRRHPEAKHLKPEHISQLPFPELHAEVARLLGFVKPPRLTLESPDDLYRENAERFYQALTKFDITLHPSILKRIKKTTALFHNNGICHRDGHERNFMITGNPLHPAIGGTSEGPRLFIIDYGNSKIFEGDYASQRDSLYEEMGHQFRSDEDIVEILTSLSVPRAEREERTERIFDQELARQYQQLNIDPKWVQLYEETSKGMIDTPIEALERAFMVSTTIPQDIDRFLVLLIRLMKEGRLKEEAARTFIEGRLSTLLPFARNKLVSFAQKLKRD